MKTIKRSGIILGLAIIVFFTCRSTSPKIIKVDPAYAKWVSGFTGGNISKRGIVRIELAKPYSPKGLSWLQSDSLLPDSNVLNDILEVEPSIKGKARWLSSRVIEFTPTEPMESGTLYTVTFNLAKVADVPKKYEEMQFQFKTWPQVLSVNPEGLKNYDQFHAASQYLTGTLKTTDEFDTSKFNKILKAKQEGRRLPIRWELNEDEENENQNSYIFYVDSVTRKEKPSKLIFEWDGDAIGANQHGEQEFTVSAISDFGLESAEVKDNGDQKVVLHFSDPIFPNQNFSEFISIEGIKNPVQFNCESNTVSIFLTERMIGTRKIMVRKGLKNAARAAMQAEQTQEVEFLAPKPMARLHGHGSVLPNSQGLRVPVETINLKAVDVRIIKIYENNVHQFLQVNELNGDDALSRVGKIIFEKKIDLGIKDSAALNKWTRHVLDLGNLIKTDLGSIYRISIKFKASYTGCGCSEEHEANGYYSEDGEEDELYEDEGSFAQNIDYDGRYYGSDQMGYNDDDAEPCSNGYYYGKALNRNILASDLGLIAKSDIKRRTLIYVSNLITAQPSPGTVLELYDYTRQIVGTATADENGMAEINPSGRPFLLVAKNGNQRGYLKLTPGNNNSMSRFETDGEMVRSGLKGFLYGERGVWRPGDSIYLTFMLDHGQKNIPENHPYTFELTGPEGQIVEKSEHQLKNGDMDILRLATSPTAPTGNYTATVTLGNLKVSKVLNIETVKPNRLKIQMEIPEKGFTVTQKAVQIPLHVKWLHGSPAPGLTTQVEMNLHGAKNVFTKYKAYTFESPLRNKFKYKSEVFNGKLDKNGNATIKAEFNGLKASPGVLQGTFVSRVYENGGDMSIDRSDALVFPFQNYIGIAGPDNGGDMWLSSGKQHWFDVVSTDANQKLVTANNVHVSVYKLEWKWWYQQESDEEQNYLSRPATYLYKDTTIQVLNGKSGFYFGIGKTEWGRYLVVVTDPKGGHECGTIVNFDYPYWGRQNGLENDGATLLSLSTNKTEYKSGETVQVTFPSAAGSRALVSIETGKKVVQSFWMNTTAGETHCSFSSTPEMSPNAYVHITLIQPHLQTINDLPIRMYGVVPIFVSDPETHLSPVIASNEVFRPEQTETVYVSETSGKPMFYTLAIVDEGLLDLTHFKTPDPHDRFYAKEAIGVKTWDIYDAVIGAFSGKMDQLLSIGGDGGFYDEESASKAQRFKPMVRFIGPFKLNAGGRAAHKIPIQNYVGCVRIMVVARNESAYGKAEKTVAVKQPLMVLSSLPRVLGPSETIKVPVTVFAMEKQVKDVTVKFNIEGEAVLTGSNTQQVHFSQIGEEMLYFELKTNPSVGLLKVNVVATGAGLTAHDDVELAIRPPNPIEARNTDSKLLPGESLKIPISWFGMKGSNSLAISTSTLPVHGFQNRLDYLIQYPHGCIEQTTSAVFAQLYLDKIMNLSTDQENNIASNIAAALKRYQTFQTSEGGFAYWPGESQSSAWGSNYAGNFLLEAEKAGYVLPHGMKEKWLKYLIGEAKTWKYDDNPYVHPHGSESFEMLQAYRLYLLAMAGKAELGAMNTLREKQNLSDAAAWRLAAAYAMVGRNDIAKQITRNIKWIVKPYQELSYTYGSATRDRAMILECMSRMNQNALAEPLFNEVITKLNSSDWLSTQEAAYSLLAVCTWATGNTGDKANLSIADSRGKNYSANTQKALSVIEIKEHSLNNSDFITIKNTGKVPAYIRQLLRGCPLGGNEIKDSKGLEMGWSFADKLDRYLNPTSIPAGTDFVAKITLKNTSKNLYRELALKEILPGGWEIMDSRLFGGAESVARYANMRDDRVYYYFDLAPGEVKTFNLRLHAAYEGDYYLPGPYAEAMYDAGIHAGLQGLRVKVTKPMPGI